MSVSIAQRLFAFFGNVWSFLLTLVRSLLALFFFRRRAADPLVLPSANRPPKDALAHAHSRLRPILLTPRSIGHVQRAHSTRTRSATSTLAPDHSEDPGPQRTSPKLDLQDAELALSVTVSFPEPTGPSADTPNTSSQTSRTGSLSVLPTPPDRCYLAPTDCPYIEPWPANKPRLPGSPLKISIDLDPAFSGTIVAPIGSPPPGQWSPPVQIWTSTPRKNDDLVPEPAPSPFDLHTRSTMDSSSGLANISHALISRSRSSIIPYDDASNSSTSSVFVNYTNEPATTQQVDSIRERHRPQAQPGQSKSQLYPQFHYPSSYSCAWPRHGTRVPGKPNRAPRTHAYTRSYSHMDLPSTKWQNEDAYAPSLSPPRGDSATEDEDEDDDEVPLSRLKARLARRTVSVGANIGLGVSIDAGTCASPRTRRMSDGCLLAISESTPTRVGGSVLSLALDGESPRDWLEALSLHFPCEQKELGPPPEPLRTLA